jgi:serine/threonine protein kinase/thioredoxin-like negative regulator of GroEL
MPFANGENVGAYRIVEKLGQGGMATVFKAYHPALDRYVAIKVMHTAFMEDPSFLARFQREARIVAKLDHPHIVPIYDYAEHQGYPYLVMRFVEGETLKGRMQRGAIEQQELLDIAKAVGGALTYAHGQGVLHRDIKPSNVLLTPDGTVYLTDFGLARMAEAGESTLSRDMMVGTPQYISPEQAQGMRDLDARTDVYSLGVMLYEMLVGQVPFTADTPFAIVHDHIFTPLPLPRELKPDLPESIERVLLKALAKEPDDRYQSVKELTQALLAAAQDGLGIPSPAIVPPPPAVSVPTPPPTVLTPPPVPLSDDVTPVSTRVPRKKKWPWIAATIVALLACAGAFSCIVVPWLEENEDDAQDVIDAPLDSTGEELLGEARAARDAGRQQEALDLYRQATEADPQLVPAYQEAADMLARTGNMQGVKDVLQEGVDATNDPMLHTQLAGLAIATDDWEVAEKELQWFQQEMPEHAFTHAYSGILTLAQGGTSAEARPELESALAIDPQLAWAHYGLAFCFLQEGDLDAARAELEFVLAQEGISPLLKRRADEMLASLDRTPEENIAAEFTAVISLTRQITDERLREELKQQLGDARAAWEEGNREEAIGMLNDTIVWVQDNRDGLDEPTARRLQFGLNLIVRLSGEEPPPPPDEEPSP